MLPLLLLFLSILSVNSLSPFLKYYEPLNYRTPDLARISRSSQSDRSVNIEMDAFNRTFKLHLRKISLAESAFAEGARTEIGNETWKIEDVNFYTGFVEGDENSRVSGSIFDGVFIGRIEMGDGKEYGIEDSNSHNSSAPFHSFIYDVEHIKMPKSKKVTKRSDGSFSSAEGFCGLSDPKIVESMQVMKNTSPSPPSRSSFRSKREPTTSTSKKNEATGIYDNRQCNILFQVDHVLYKRYYDTKTKNGDSAENRRNAAIDQLKAQIHQEVKAVNEVYLKEHFDGITGVMFAIADIKIFESADEDGNPYKDENLDVNAFLGANSMQNLGEYCLGYAMTYRDFAGGTLGLAYVKGLCANHRASSATQRSSNAGIVTYLNHGQQVLLGISYLTLAHEIGHNFGSPHDESEECNGGGNGNEYIMWFSATSGQSPNNKKFSPCSIKIMSEKLKQHMVINPDDKSGGDRNCFVPVGEPVCGNGITEKDKDGNEKEQCDCGKDQEECNKRKDFCCHPGDANKDDRCKLKTGKKCSISQGPCCKEDCDFQPANFPCLEASDCAQSAVCPGNSVKCNTPAPRNEKEPCNDATGACYDGVCNTTRLCETAGLEDCSSGEQSCMRYCMKDGVCQSTAKLVTEFADKKYIQKGRWGHPGVMMRPTSGCMQGKGTCNQFDMCKKVQVTGSISRNMGEIVKGFKSFGDLMMNKIWVLILVVIGVVAVLVVVIKFCSYATPSSNPNKPKAKSMKEIKNMMSNRAKRLSQRVKRKKTATPSTPGTADQTPVDKTKTKETNDDEES